MSFGNLLTELLSELIVLALVGGFIYLKQKRTLKKIRSKMKELELTQLNVETKDEVLLIDHLNDLSKVELSEKINSATVILMRDDKGFYNIVVRNAYGSEGIIK